MKLDFEIYYEDPNMYFAVNDFILQLSYYLCDYYWQRQFLVSYIGYIVSPNPIWRIGDTK